VNAQRGVRRGRPAAPEPVRVNGLPHRLTAVAPLATGEAEWVRVRVNLANFATDSPLLALLVPVGATAAQLKLTLPQTTPPGTYAGTVEVGGRERPLQIDVEPHVSLAFYPDAVKLRAEAGSPARAEMTVANRGNVPIEIRPTYALGFVDVHALDHGLDEAARPSLRDGQARLNAFFEALARGSGGAARLEVTTGGGSLAPGEARTLNARFRLPKELRAGHTYASNWDVEQARFSIRVEVAETSSQTGREEPS
jgi:hypothetical protein